MAWVWNRGAKRYQNTDNGQFLSFERALDLVDQSLATSGNRNSRLAELAGNNEISPLDWRDRFRQELKEEYIRQSIFGRGGRDRMTQSDWGAIGRRLQDQYELMDGITAQIAEGEYSEGQIKVIQDNFINSSRQVYERSKAVSQDIPPGALPAMPGDGSTVCVCITTPYSRVLTRDGWKAIVDVQIGDYVWTHKLRWRRVLNSIIKSSQPYHRQVHIRIPNGEWVGATDNHLWHTSKGWLNSSDIDNLKPLMYHLSNNIFERIDDEKILRKVQCSPIESKQAKVMSGMSVSVPLWESEGLQGQGVHILWSQSQSKDSMAENAPQDGQECARCNETVQDTPIRESILEHKLAEKDGRSLLRICMAAGQEDSDLPLSMGLDNSQWSNTRGPCNSSQEWGLLRRQNRELGTDDTQQACAISWGNSQEQKADLEVSRMRERLPETKEKQESSAQILFSSMLPENTPIYDLTIEEDASFLIEGLFAHNSGCKCAWRFEFTETEILAYWGLESGAKHCPDCLRRAREWNPYRIPISEE